MTNATVQPKLHFRFFIGLALAISGGYLDAIDAYAWYMTTSAIVVGFLLLRHELVWHWAYSLSAVVGLSLLVVHWWPLLMFFAAFPKTKHVRVIEEGSDMNTSKTNYWLMALYLSPLAFSAGLLFMGYLSSGDELELAMTDAVYRKLLVIVPAILFFAAFAWVSLKGALSVLGVGLLFWVFGFSLLYLLLAVGVVAVLKKRGPHTPAEKLKMQRDSVTLQYSDPMSDLYWATNGESGHP